MKNPVLLFCSSSKLDVLFLRNKIQIISSIPVLVKKEDGVHLLFTEALHCRKAKVILDNYLRFLPSNLFPKRKEVVKPSIETNIAEHLELSLDCLRQKINVLLNKNYLENIHLLS